MIKIGDKLPETAFKTMGKDGPQEKTGSDLFKNKRVLLVGAPGAFTPACHRNHVPGYIQNADALTAKGIDKIYVTTVNDVFVMGEWEKASNANGKITFLADGSADFAKAAGLSLDASAHGLGIRSQRYAMVVNDGTVESLAVEDVPSNVGISGAEEVLKTL
ncbi:MAG: peroxiredoxin [Pseudomonadota bacterium]